MNLIHGRLKKTTRQQYCVFPLRDSPDEAGDALAADFGAVGGCAVALTDHARGRACPLALHLACGVQTALHFNSCADIGCDADCQKGCTSEN